MVNGFVGRLQTRLAELRAQVAEYEVALKVGEREARVERDGSFKGAFAAKGSPAPRARKPAKRRRMRNLPHGVLRDFVQANASPDGAPGPEARRLRSLARKQGIKTTHGSMVQAVYVHRRAQRDATGPDLETPVYDYVQKHGPMPHTSISEWFKEQYPDVYDAQPRKTVALLTALKSKQKMRLTSDGWWEAL